MTSSKKKQPRLHKNWIDQHALGIVKALQSRGFETYLVGGCVRDLLLGIIPKDFDIATTARPEEVRRTIFKSFVIGKRFRLVLVKRDDQQFEVATFRREVREEEATEDMPAGDNVFGSPEEDAKRRDFTINALFYDPVKDRLIDYAEGIPDLQNHVLRMIGDPTVRLLEDPIRILRALRFAHKLGFSIERSLRKAMKEQAPSLARTVLPRRREEILKILRLNDPALALTEAYDLGILEHLSPSLNRLLAEPEKGEAFIRRMAQFHDKPVQTDDPAELFGHLMHVFIRSAFFPDPDKLIRSKDILENSEILIFMRDELGMFKSEQSLFARAIQTQGLLKKREEFARRGAKRKMALVRSEAFPLALQFAERDCILSSNDLLFWTMLDTESMADPDFRRATAKPPMRKRRRRRKPPPK